MVEGKELTKLCLLPSIAHGKQLRQQKVQSARCEGGGEWNEKWRERGSNGGREGWGEVGE